MSAEVVLPPTIHASAVMVGDRGVLIRGPSGSGKSRLAWRLILAGRAGVLPPAVLIGDDRVHLAVRAGALVASPAAALAGLIEIWGLGIRRCAFQRSGAVSLVVDLAASDAARMPEPEALAISVDGVTLARVPIAEGCDALPLVAAALTLQV